MKLKKGDRFTNYLGKLCFISYIRLNVLKVVVIGENSYTEVWDRLDFISEISRNRFIPQPVAVVNRTNITDHLLEYQLNMIGKTTKDAYKLEDWFMIWTMTDRQYQLFKTYAIPLLKKVFKFNKAKAESTFNWFNLQYGLRIVN